MKGQKIRAMSKNSSARKNTPACKITSHVLDTHLGRPAAGVAVSLSRWESDAWMELARAETNTQGRVEDWLPKKEQVTTIREFTEGRYRIRFETGAYFKKVRSFYPFVEVVFEIQEITEFTHYHVPLLISAFGYSTYRGS